jgi:hypothetical protein
MMNRKYITKLNVGVAQTFGGGVAIGGDGKFDERVKTVAKSHGMHLSHETTEWFTRDGAKYAEILASLELAAGRQA